MGQKFIIDESTINKIANYLFMRPWAEVNDIIVDMDKQVSAHRQAMAKKPELVPQPPKDGGDNEKK